MEVVLSSTVTVFLCLHAFSGICDDVAVTALPENLGDCVFLKVEVFG